MLTADFNLRMARAVDLSHTEWLGLLLDRALTEPGDQRLLPQAAVKKLGYRATPLPTFATELPIAKEPRFGRLRLNSTRNGFMVRRSTPDLVASSWSEP